MSRVTRWLLVTMPTGLLKSLSTSRIWRVILQLALDRLVGIGVGAHRDRRRAGTSARRARAVSSLAASGLNRILVSKSRPGEQAEIGVGRPGEAVDAAVLAAAIGVDRAVEGDVGRGVARDDGARGVVRQRRAQRRQLVLVEDVPAVGRTDLLLVVEAARRVAERAAAVVLRLGDLIVGIVGWNGRRMIGRLLEQIGTSQAIDSDRIDWLSVRDSTLPAPGCQAAGSAPFIGANSHTNLT